MKPRSKMQIRYVSMAERLPDITGKVLEWAKSTLFEDKKVGYYDRRSRRVWCMCCGHQGEASDSPLVNAVAYECSGCGRLLSVYKGHYRQQMHWEKWFYVVDVFEGVQVVRMYEASRRIDESGEPARYGVRELFQKWLDDSGKEVITSRPYVRFFNCLYFRTGEPYGIAEHNESCNGMYHYPDLFVCRNYRMYPEVRLSPLLRRNGCSKRLLSYIEHRYVDVFEAMQKIMTDNTVETLVKIRQNALAVYYLKQPSFNMRDYMHAVNICTRNSYRVKDADMWLDYIHSLIITGTDSHNAKYVCPPDLRKAHDRMMERLGTCPHSNGEIHIGTAARAADYRDKMKRFDGLVIMSEVFSVTPVMNLAALKKEGEEMAHCVYKNKYDKRNSLIMSVRARTRKKERIATVEVGLDSFTVLQCRGKNNAVPKFHREIQDLVSANMNKIRQCVNNG